MNKQILGKIKESLEAEKAKLERDLGTFTTKDDKVADNYKANFPEFGNDEEENAAEVAAYGDNLSIEHTLEKQLRDVNKAIASVDSDEYGICKYCKKPIKEERLLARPTSTSCVECKKALKGE